MIDGALIEAIAAALSTAFPGVYVGLPQDDGRITMPAITMQLRSDFIVGSRLERGTLTLMVCSQADDSTPEDHAAFCYQVSEFMRTLSIQSNVVKLDGLVASTADEQHAERHWQTPLVYIIGFSPKP